MTTNPTPMPTPAQAPPDRIPPPPGRAPRPGLTPIRALSSLTGGWFENPLLIKHLRSRLRRSQFLPAAAVVGAICILISWGGWTLGGFASGGTFGVLLGLQAIILAIVGASQVSAAVGGARESGILDFHRVSPLTPTAVTLGFFFGAPAREYLLFAMTLPFTLVCVANGAPGPAGALQTMVVLFLSAWLLQGIGLVTALSSKKPKAGARGIIGLVVFFFIFGGQFGFLALSRASSYVGDSPTLSFFGIALPWLATVLIYGVPTLFFLLLSSVRKMRSERAHALSKPQAVALLATVAVLVLGKIWDIDDVRGFPYTLVVLYTLVAVGCVVTMTITPNLGEFTKGFRRAERRGRAHAGYWDDLAPNRVALVALCGIVLAAATVAWHFLEAPSGGHAPGMAFDPFYRMASYSVTIARTASYSVTIAIGVLVVAYFGLAAQFFQMTSARRGAAWFGLFLFVAWLVPLVVGTIAGAASSGRDAALFIVSLSPVAGIALSARMSDDTGTQLIQAAALGPAVVFAFLFNNLVTVARRRAIKQIHAPADLAKPEAARDPLAL